jgi:drug/metabolite transporter (DMT)-like permease
VLNATTPVFTVLVLHLFTRDEKLTAPKLAGVGLGLAGVAVLIGPDLSRLSAGSLWAQLAVLGAALSYAFAGLWGRRFVRLGVTPVAAATGQVTMSALLLIPAALLVDRSWTLSPSAPTWAALIALGVLSTALAYVLFFRILAAAGATNVMLVTLLVPVSAVLLGALFLGERLSPPQLAGMGLIGLGLAAIDGRLLRRFRDAI